MDQELKWKYMALAILANSGNLKRAQFCSELRKITSLDHLLFTLDRITDAAALRRGLNVFTHHSGFTLKALFTILPESHYLDHQEMLGDALLRHRAFDLDHLFRFLTQAGYTAGIHIIDQLAQDQMYQLLLIDFFLRYEYPEEYSQGIAEAITRYPLTIEQLSSLITTTDNMRAKLVFAKAAVQINDLDDGVVRDFFDQITDNALREVEFINAIHPSAGETFFTLLIQTEFEPAREACLRKLLGCAHSIETIESWQDRAENQGRADATRWLDHLLLIRYKNLTTPELLDLLVNLRDGKQVRRSMITDTLSCDIDRLREIAGITQPK